jgi:small multidrug resistance family-3 protein
LLKWGEGYLVWKWLRERKGIAFGVFSGITLFFYRIIPTLQPSNFGRVYAAYCGFFIISAVLWGYFIDKKRPDRFEIIESLTVVVGAIIIFYAPR